MRNYQNGLVIVNPAGLQGFNLSLGSTYTDMWGGAVGPNWYIPPQTGIVLLGAGATGGSATTTATATATATATVTATRTITPTATSTVAKTGTMMVYPYSGTYASGQVFEVSLYAFGNGTPFNAAQANVTVSNNLTVLDVVQGTCNLTYSTSPSMSSLSFAGSSGSGIDSCVVYYLRLRANGAGSAVVSLSSGSMNAAGSGADILKSMTSGHFTIQ